jgi:site-specific DNA-methyltransferase (adenine-specific)
MEQFLGKVTQGDCLELMKQLPDKCIDLVLTDPPYGIDYQSNMRTVSKKFDKLQNDDNSSRLLAYTEFYRILKDDCVAIIFCSFKNYAEDYIELQKLFNIKNCIIWNKGGGGIGDLEHSLLTDYEMAIVAHKGMCNIRGKRDGSVWNFGKVFNQDMVHPTEKPVFLIQKCIEKFSDTNNIVLDSYSGSGSCGVACVKTKRQFIGFELEQKYVDIANKRIQDESRKLTLF